MRITVRSSDLIAFILRPLEGAVAEALRTMEMQLGTENAEEKAEDAEAVQKPVPRAQGQEHRAHVEPVRPLPPAQAPLPKPSTQKTDRPVLRLRPRTAAPEQPGRRRTYNRAPDPQQPLPPGTSLQANVANNSVAAEPPRASAVRPAWAPPDVSAQATAAQNSVFAGSPIESSVLPAQRTDAPAQASFARNSVLAGNSIESSVLPAQRTAMSGDGGSGRGSDPRQQDGRDHRHTAAGFNVETHARGPSASVTDPSAWSAPARTQEVPVDWPAPVPTAVASQIPTAGTERRLGRAEPQGHRGDAHPSDAAPVAHVLRSGPAEPGRRRLLVKAIAEPVVPSGIPAPAPPEPSRPKSAATMAMARDLAQPLRPILGDLHKRSVAIKSESASPAAPRTVLQVNVHIGANASGPAAPGSSAGSPLDLDALTDALAEALAEAARREGIEV